jgi:hypothetical protein
MRYIFCWTYLSCIQVLVYQDVFVVKTFYSYMSLEGRLDVSAVSLFTGNGSLMSLQVILFFIFDYIAATVFLNIATGYENHAEHWAGYAAESSDHGSAGQRSMPFWQKFEFRTCVKNNFFIGITSKSF